MLTNDEVLFREGEMCNYVGIVIDGMLRISSITLSGNELLLKNLKKGDLFGNNLVYSKKPIYRGNVISVSDNSEVVLFTKENLEKALASSPEFLRFFLTKTAEDGNDLTINLKMISIMDIKERLLYYLSVNGNSITMKSVTDLSLRLNIRRETLSRLLTKLEMDGDIERSGNRISLIVH